MCESEVAQLCLILSDPMDCSPPASSIHGIFQARVLGWGAIAFSASSLTRGQNQAPCIGSMESWPLDTREVPELFSGQQPQQCWMVPALPPFLLSWRMKHLFFLQMTSSCVPHPPASVGPALSIIPSLPWICTLFLFPVNSLYSLSSLSFP